MKIKEGIWKMIQWRMIKKRLGYTDEEMKIFREMGSLCCKFSYVVSFGYTSLEISKIYFLCI